VPVLLLGNKVDLPNAVREEEIYFALGLDELQARLTEIARDSPRLTEVDRDYPRLGRAAGGCVSAGLGWSRLISADLG